MIGSSSTGLVFKNVSRKQPRAQTWKAMSELSTSWYEPSSRIAFTPTIGIEAAHMTVARMQWLERTISSRGLPIALRSTERVVERARLLKSPAEIAALREAAVRLRGVADAAFAAVRVGVTERDVAWAI